MIGRLRKNEHDRGVPLRRRESQGGYTLLTSQVTKNSFTMSLPRYSEDPGPVGVGEVHGCVPLLRSKTKPREISDSTSLKKVYRLK